MSIYRHFWEARKVTRTGIENIRTLVLVLPILQIFQNIANLEQLSRTFLSYLLAVFHTLSGQIAVKLSAHLCLYIVVDSAMFRHLFVTFFLL